MTSRLMWPNGKKVAVSVTVMFETWADDKAPTYSVQTTHLKSGTVDHAGKAWSTYGGRVGVWRIINLLDRLGIPGTFFVNARCTEQYPDAGVASSCAQATSPMHTAGSAFHEPQPRPSHAQRHHCAECTQQCGGKKVTGWASPVVAFTPETAGFLAKAGLTWTTDITYVDLPIKIHTPHGTIAGVPTTDFSDNRVLRATPRDLYDTYKGTFDYLVQNEPMGLIVMVIHCQFGGRPLISAVLNELLSEVARSPDVWFARHEELGSGRLPPTSTNTATKAAFSIRRGSPQRPALARDRGAPQHCAGSERSSAERSSTQKIHLEAGPAHDRIARLLHRSQKAFLIDAHQLATILLHFAGDEDGLDMAGIHQIHDGAWRVVERPDIRVGPPAA
jgi:hypothetical protein